MKKLAVCLLVMCMIPVLCACYSVNCMFCGAEMKVSSEDMFSEEYYCTDCYLFHYDLIGYDEPVDDSFDNSEYGFEDDPETSTDYFVNVEDMEDGRPYILRDGNIHTIEEMDIEEGCLSEEKIMNIPLLSEEDQIIVRSNSADLDPISIYSLDISFGQFINPYVRFYYRQDTGRLYCQSNRSYVRELEDAVEIDNIDGITEYSEMPLRDFMANRLDYDSYYLCCNDEPSGFLVGYWRGTNYEEIVLEASCVPAEWWSDSWYDCDYSRTYDGYFSVNTPQLESGYYVLRVIGSGNYAICVE